MSWAERLQKREVSLMSGSDLKALRDARVDAEVFDPQVQDIEELVSKDYDRAFLILHGKGGEDGVIQGLMEYIKLPIQEAACLLLLSALIKL